ncbi:MAG: aminotransferase class V-fold PLP-dependent enzyme [Anaerolineales bacterium]
MNSLRTHLEHVAPNYFNHAGCSVITERTLRAVVEQLELEARVGSFSAEKFAAPDKDTLYELAAKTIGASPSSITLTDSHTTGWEKAFQLLDIQSGDVLLTTRSEWGGNYKSMHHRAQQVGARVEVVESDRRGAVDLEKLPRLLRPKVKLISVTWLGSNGGHLEPAQAIGALARSHGVPYFLDASQVVGQMPVDVGALGCDVLSTPGRKWLRGPKGTGFTYFRPDFLIKLQETGALEALLEQAESPTPKHFEAPSTSCPLHMGLKSALEQLEEAGIENVQRQILVNINHLRDGLQTIPKVMLLNSDAPEHGLLSFTVQGFRASEIQAQLLAMGLEVSANQATFTPLDMQARNMDAVVRVSPHSTTTLEARDALVLTLHELCNRA